MQGEHQALQQAQQVKQAEASRDRDEAIKQSYQNLKHHREELERRGQSRRRFDDF